MTRALGLALLLLLVGCSDRTPVPREQLIDLLIELAKVQGWAATQTPKTAVADSLARGQYQQVLARAGVSAADFEATLAYYRQRPASYEALLEEAIHRMTVTLEEGKRDTAAAPRPTPVAP